MRKAILSKYNAYLRRARTATLGTKDPIHGVHLVPIVFASSANYIYFVIDKKRKKDSKQLRRLSNIKKYGRATLLIQNYFEEWQQLSYLLLYCDAKILDTGLASNEKKAAAKLLKKKYAQYRGSHYFPHCLNEAIFVRLMPDRLVYWQNSRHSLA